VIDPSALRAIKVALSESIKAWGYSELGGAGAPSDKGYIKIYSNELWSKPTRKSRTGNAETQSTMDTRHSQQWTQGTVNNKNKNKCAEDNILKCWSIFT
jgi:hypothetical protein